ncbi:solute carrier family 13 (sodium-dependent dicarboxylate transporter), member 2/3/5 [Marinilactibacillus piezotolerans]|uniref:Sodium-dependent dicarboxylate transporter SdcS n=1 Tax=Marinilactibacillus piezotolerans TaxID=258723 RepID=A0A1I4A1S6_9LACT|nr:DASS family sodium-coupled anion symporter [Marinilactibacillus piezotolerans]SFK50258.1 solute carrier family 13 (sodium-dependent dicarboxylate transporter), member 2/3/5 [Marinilactibacillus piezotolerans]
MQFSLKKAGLILGPSLFFLLYFIPSITGLENSPRAVLGVTAWVAIWWITEALPIPATSLLPIILLPLTGGADQATATMAYGNPIVFMYMGGFTIAIAIEKWNLHRRIAMSIISILGTSSNRIILGVGLATAFLSMWISNAATALMMLPIAIALITEIKEKKFFNEKSLQNFSKGLLLMVAYSASIGGLATIVGSVPNAAFVAVANSMLNQNITFSDWFLFGIIVTTVLMVVLYFYITKIKFPVEQNGEISSDFARQQLKDLGPMSIEEKMVSVIFCLIGSLWIFGGFLPFALSDTTISMTGAVLLFMIPSSKGGRILDWIDMKHLSWGLLLLFGGGLSLAAAFESSGLTSWFGDVLSNLEQFNYLVILIILTATILFMTEIMSNTAVSNMLMPISVGLAAGIGVAPYGIMAVVALASSCAFMLPISTPPNAAVFSTNELKIEDMVKAGFWMNIVSVVVIVLAVYFLQPIILNF